MKKTLESGALPEPSPAVKETTVRRIEDRPPEPGEPPYKGLAPFNTHDADIFFGREYLIQRLHERIHGDAHIVAVVGPSGSGKSSLVRAGLIPRLEAEVGAPGTEVRSKGTWATALFTPSEEPLQAMGRALARSGDVHGASLSEHDFLNDERSLYRAAMQLLDDASALNLLLVVDQFEELFTLCDDEFQRQAFLRNISFACSEARAAPVAMLFTLRSDFYSQCARYPLLREALSSAQEFIGPMEAEDIRRAIELPAGQGKWELQPGLVDLIMRDVRGEPGSLPLLSHALLECWERRSGHTMTLRGYAAAGGVRGAIAKTAERVYQSLSTDQKRIARRILLRLTDIAEGSIETRRRAAISELISGYQQDQADAREVLDLLAGERSITMGQEWVEVAHEALIREWPTLQSWLEGSREALRIHRHLTRSAQDWEARAEDDADLYRGARLQQALEWAQDHSEDLNELERAFLAASVDLADRKRAEQEALRRRELEAAKKLAEAENARAEEQASASRRLRVFAYALAGLLIASLLAAGLALQQRNIAAREAHMARARELAAAALNNLDADPELSVLLSLEALKESDLAGEERPRQVVEILHRSVLNVRTELVLRGHTDRIFDAQFNADASLVATASADGTIRVWSADDGEERFRLTDGAPRPVKAVDFHPGGRYLASGGNDRVVRIWDLLTGQLVSRLQGHSQWVQDVKFTPDGELLASAGRDAAVQIWDWEQGRLTQTLSTRWPLAALAFSPDGEQVAAVNAGGQVLIWQDIEMNSQPTSTLGDASGNLQTGGIFSSIAISPDGQWIVAPDMSGAPMVWSKDSLSQRQTLEAGVDVSTDVAFSPEGSRLATVGFDRRVHIWDTESWRISLRLTGHSDRLYAAAFSPDGERLVTAGEDQTARIWNLSLPRELTTIAIPGEPDELAFNPSRGVIVASSAAFRGLYSWDTLTGEGRDQIPLFGDATPPISMDLAPDGDQAAVGGAGGDIIIWDLEMDQELFRLAGHDAPVTDLEFSTDGRLLLSGSADLYLAIWDLATRERSYQRLGPGDVIRAVAFAPGAKRISVGDARGAIIVWDFQSDRVQNLTAHEGGINALTFSPDGSLLASVSDDGTGRIWDLEDPHRSLDLVGHGAPVEDIAFSPEGSHVATVSGDGTLRLWDVASGDEDLALSSAAWGEFKEVAFHPDGKTLAVSDAKGIYILLTYADDLARLARERATRGFSREECRMYLPGEGCAIRPEEEPTVAPYLPPPEGYRGCELSEAGGVYDGGYNQEVYEGILLVSEQLGWDRYVYESEFLDDPPRAMRRLLRSNCDLIVAPGFLFTGLIENAAQRYPDQAFQLIDVSVEDPEDNLWIQLYAPDQAAFLAGYLAASVSQTRTVATFGGLPIQPVLDFMVGFEAGVAHYNNLHSEDVEVLGWDIASGEGEFVGDFCCPPDGIEISQRLIDQGADVVMPVAGPWVGLGGMIAARDNPGVLFIGVDVDQAEATPEYAGVILTSVEKHIRLSVLRAAQAIEAGTFQGGTYIGTLETGEVGLSPFHELDDRVPERVRAELAVIEAQIIAGEIETKP